jgi:hypothetical protein
MLSALQAVNNDGDIIAVAQLEFNKERPAGKKEHQLPTGQR